MSVLSSNKVSLVAALLAGASACGRSAYDPEARLDAGSLDAATPDAGPVLACGGMVPVLGEVPAVTYGEASLHIDGNTLVARQIPGAAGLFESVRADATSPFAAFGEVTVVNASIQDQTFAFTGGLGLGANVIAMGADSEMGPRQLVICLSPSAGSTCETVVVFDEVGGAITDDIDGPSLAVLDGSLVLAFNRGDAVYFARPRSGLLEWDAAEVDLVIPGATSDDPALTSDGLYLFASMPDGVYALRWSSANQRYEAPRLVVAEAGAPAVGVESQGAIELFVSATTRGISEPHRVPCAL